MADHKVLGDLLHVLVVEEAVEAQLVCKPVTEGWDERRIQEGRQGERMEG